MTATDSCDATAAGVQDASGGVWLRESRHGVADPRVLLVLNRASGGVGDAGPDEILQLLRDRLTPHGIGLDVVDFAPKRLRRLLDASLTPQVQAVFVAGGDGTVLAVAQALHGRDLPIGILPLGTMNWVARDLGIPLEIEAAVDALLAAPARPVDAARVNGYMFLCACMVGFSPLVARWRERERGRSPWLLWPRLLWRALGLLQRYRPLKMRLVTAQTSEKLHSRTLVVTNNVLVGTPGLLPQRTRLDEGVVGVYAVRKVSAAELTRLGMRLMVGSWQEDDAVLALAAPTAVVGIARRRRLTILIDGERVRVATPLRFESMPAALTLLAPALGEQQ